MSSHDQSRARTRNMVTAALLAALLCVSAYLTIPLQPVPVTLQMFIVVLIALLLPAGWAAAAVGTYLALGAVGVPVFSGGQGGPGVIMGPTGGYLVGFLVAVAAAAVVRASLHRFVRRDLLADIVAATVVIMVVYVVGTAQLALVTQMGPAKAVAAGVLPFIVPDAIKAGVGIVIARAIRRATRA